LVSSLAVHRFHPYRNGDEGAPRNARLTPYAESKILAEDLALRYQARGLIETVIVRPGLFPFGPRDRTSLVKLVGGLRRRLYAHINGGRSVFCTAYVENLVEGILLAGIEPKAAGETFVIADEQPVNWESLIAAFCEQLGIEEIRRSLPGWLAYALAGIVELLHKAHLARGEPAITRYRVKVPAQDFFFSSEKARRMLGFRPRVSFPEAVERTMDWYKTEILEPGEHGPLRRGEGVERSLPLPPEKSYLPG
jgi:nucleoside-diphosphate-sugar epimerase